MMINIGNGQEMDESLLEKREGIDEDRKAKIYWVEYYLNGVQVHRSAHIAFKDNIQNLTEKSNG
jgi:hypothetical protein